MSDPLAEMAEFCLNLTKKNAKLRAEKSELIAAAEAVIARWETPKWKEAGPTAEAVYKLRDVVERVKEVEK